MNQFMTAEMQQWLRRPNISAILMTELDFASGLLRLHSSVGDALYQGLVYKGTGVLGKVGMVKQSGQVQPYRLRLTLSGIPQELASIALTEHYQNRQGSLYLAALDNFCQIVARDTLFSGRMDVMNIRLGNPSTIQLDLNSRGVDWKNPRNSRYTDADQQARHPGDKFFEFVSQMAEKEIFWGVPGKAVGGSGGGGGGGGRGTAQNQR